MTATRTVIEKHIEAVNARDPAADPPGCLMPRWGQGVRSPVAAMGWVPLPASTRHSPTAA